MRHYSSRADMGLEDSNQPRRPGVGLLSVESEACAATDRQVLLSELRIRATAAQEENGPASVRTVTITGLPILVPRSYIWSFKNSHALGIKPAFNWQRRLVFELRIFSKLHTAAQ